MWLPFARKSVTKGAPFMAKDMHRNGAIAAQYGPERVEYVSTHSRARRRRKIGHGESGPDDANAPEDPDQLPSPRMSLEALPNLKLAPGLESSAQDRM